MNRIQTLRSSTPGARPTGRAPGELYVNWPDLQLGVVDSTSAPVDLIAVRYFSTLTSYAIGDFTVQAGFLYRAMAAVTPGPFNPAQWDRVLDAAGVVGVYLPLAGGTLTGLLNGTSATFSATVVGGSARFASGIELRGAPGSRFIFGSSPTASARWLVNYGDNAVESGANAGSNFSVQNFSDAGGLLSTPLAIDRATGLVTIPHLSAPQAIGENRIINGGMRIDQRNNGASSTAINGYTIDRWQYTAPTVGVITWTRTIANVGLAALGFANNFSLNITTAHPTIAATDNFAIAQPIEADMVSDFAWGTPNAQPVTLSFLISTTLPGTYSGSIRNAPAPSTRSYPFSFTYTGPGWQKITVTIPGDTAGAWVMNGNAAGLYVTFNLGVGTNYQGPANVWSNGNLWGVAGSTNWLATVNNIWTITGVKLEVGTVATPFNRQSMAKSMADCQRYYWQSNNMMIQGNANNVANPVYNWYLYPVAMRASPTVALGTPVYNNASALASQVQNDREIRFQLTIIAVGYGYANANPLFTFGAEL
jgi:hypothetical protein